MGKRSTRTEQRPQVYGYVRVSTEEQAESGLSLRAQRERIAAHAVARGETHCPADQAAAKWRPRLAGERLEADGIRRPGGQRHWTPQAVSRLYHALAAGWP